MPKYGIEIAGPHNENAVFSPTGDRIRGRWDFAKVSHRDKDESMKALAARIDTIPGIYILLDTEQRVGLLSDPLAETPQGKAVLENVNSVFKEYSAVFGGPVDPMPKAVHKLSVDQVKTWAHYMRAMVNSGMAVSLAGMAELPTPEFIATKFPGKRLRDPLNTGPQTAEKDDPAREFGLCKWTDEVPLDAGKGELVGAGAGGEGKGKGKGDETPK